MKNLFKLLAVLALVAVIGFSAASCKTDDGGDGDPDLSGNITISPAGPATIGTELTATYSGTEAVAYQWKKDGGNVGTNSNKHTPTTEGSYTVTVSADGFKSKTSDPVTVTAPTLPTLTFTKIEHTFPGEINGVAYLNGAYWAYGREFLSTSPDGSTGWTEKLIATDTSTRDGDAVSTPYSWSNQSITGMAYGSGKYVIVAGTRIAYSGDGTTWTIADLSASFGGVFSTNNVWDVIFANNKFVAVGRGTDTAGRIATSTDGVTWTQRDSGNSDTASAIYYRVVYDGARFVTISSTGYISTSTDGETWARVTKSDGLVASVNFVGASNVSGFAYGNNIFVAYSDTNRIMAYAAAGDLASWTSVDKSLSFPTSTANVNKIYSLAFGKGVFIAVGRNGPILLSSNGIHDSWEAILETDYASVLPLTNSGRLNMVSSCNGKLFFAGYDQMGGNENAATSNVGLAVAE